MLESYESNNLLFVLAYVLITGRYVITPVSFDTQMHLNADLDLQDRASIVYMSLSKRICRVICVGGVIVFLITNNTNFLANIISVYLITPVNK